MNNGVIDTLLFCLQGTPKMTSTAHLVVHVLDINDNPPEFEHSMYQVSASEALPVGDTVATMFATSRDTGVNADITYTIVNGNEHNRFSIDAKLGNSC